MERYLIALDGGGTKTEGVLCSADGTVKNRVLLGPSNPNDIGVAASVNVLASAIEALTAECGGDEIFLHAGIAGAGNHGEEIRVRLSEAFPRLRISISTDAINLISGEIPFEDGACMISGTGSVCYVRKGDELYRIGGWGYLLDGAGSGYDIGRTALEYALKEIDGRRKKSSVGKLVEQFLGGPADKALSEIYEKGKPFIASLAEPILSAAEKGDLDCYGIVELSIRAWAEMLDRAYAILQKPFRAALGGGLFTHCPWLMIDLSMNLSSHVEVSIAESPMVYGAMIEAAKAASLDGVGEKKMKQTFLRSYRALTGEGPLPVDDED